MCRCRSAATADATAAALGDPPRSPQHPVAAGTGRGFVGRGPGHLAGDLGIFKNPGVVAVALGLGNAALLCGGWFITTRTRYQTAGRAHAAGLPGHALEPLFLPRP